MRKKWYCGLCKQWLGTKFEAFSAQTIPTAKDYPQFGAVWGPFRTKRGAKWAEANAAGNPLAQTVAECERFAKEATQ